ncbi:MAG: undecaprenyl-diphosphatase [Spirochaetae bacterium HGW-Spirochaetae-8]|jgi:undecaprenyl-diphosphatase|nr:MAG: undecaprenyl-diphosphatase [Spirochaetae bacterium HGW-Spirochaetae-8]
MLEELTTGQGLFLGLVQGVTEFLPVSSSGHLVLFRAFFQISEVPLLFDVWLHVATLLVILVYYRVLITRLVVVSFRFLVGRKREEDASDLKLIATVIAATVLTVAVALGLRAFGGQLSPEQSVSVLLLVTAALLVSTVIPKGKTTYAELTWKNALITGIAQGFGTLAGISRSGITISAALWSGMDRKSAGEYTFILSIPAVLGALVLTVVEGGGFGAGVPLLPIVAGCIAAAVSGAFALRLLLWMVTKARLWYFSIYLLVVSIIGLILFF